MDKVIVGSAKTGTELLIDECRKKHGLWFDSGELQDILRHAELDDDSRIQHLLAEMFAEQRTEDNKEN
jgi:Zn-finger nucleic acid-binding protein